MFRNTFMLRFGRKAVYVCLLAATLGLTACYDESSETQHNFGGGFAITQQTSPQAIIVEQPRPAIVAPADGAAFFEQVPRPTKGRKGTSFVEADGANENEPAPCELGPPKC